MMKEIEVVAAVIQHEGKIFCAQRGTNAKEYLAYKYEFPGGKTETGETHEAALIREIDEELNWVIQVDEPLITVHHTYPDFKIIMHAFLCTPLDLNFRLNEHMDYVWLPISELYALDWAAADLPIIDQLSYLE